mgnify:FL=1
MIKKILLFFFSLLIIHNSLFISPVTAALEDPQGFSTSYDVTYDVGLDGVTIVTNKITLKNLTSQYYATSFSLTIGSTRLTDVLASDDGGSLEANVEKKGTSTTITVKFNQQVTGVGKTLPWTLSYKSMDFASSQGRVWEVSTPKVAADKNLESYNLTLSVPQSFGTPTAITPTPKTRSQSFNKLFFTFDKDQLQSSGVSASFGDKQLFDFDLKYHLENKNFFPVLTNITLPPDSAFQDVIFQAIVPTPINVTLDDDGNYLAWYRLKRGERIEIKVVGSARLYNSSKVKNPSLPEELRTNYTQATRFWSSDNPLIKSKLSEILGTNSPESNFEKAQLIHRFVAGYLRYDSSRLKAEGIERLGAVTALTNPQSAVCMEYTDLFIALARAAGIPARELDGYAYTANPELRPLSLSRDILHAWPEFWDEKKGWIMIDPTWESTTGGVDYFNKLDLNHFVFAIKGLSSENPSPAGSYKVDGNSGKDVSVTFSDSDFELKPRLDVSITPAQITAGFPNKIKVRINNLGNSLHPSDQLTFAAGQLIILN